jgi:hypothetical protein
MVPGDGHQTERFSSLVKIEDSCHFSRSAPQEASYIALSHRGQRTSLLVSHRGQRRFYFASRFVIYYGLWLLFSSLQELFSGAYY